MTRHWGVWFRVTGEVRFLSHHDMMRLLERAAGRARLPVRYSEGFNPRPKLSLVLPRPVGVASRCELLTVELTAEMAAPALQDRLAEQLPAGMSILQVEPLPAAGRVHPRQATYQMHLRAAELPDVRAQLARLAKMDAWSVPRQRPPAKRRKPAGHRTVDVKDRVLTLEVRDETLHFTITCTPSAPARCLDVLMLAGLTPPPGAGDTHAAGATEALARVERTEIECDGPRRDTVRRDCNS